MQSTANNDSGSSSNSSMRTDLISQKVGFDISKIDEPLRWNSDWEKALRLLSATPPTELFDLFGSDYLRDSSTSFQNAGDLIQSLWDDVYEHQTSLLSLYHELDKGGRLKTLWVLLLDRERQKHIQAGLYEACRTALWKHDARALCPEITLKKFSKGSGKAFLAFIDEYRKGVQSSAPDVYFLPSELWASVLEREEPITELTADVSTFLTLLRNDFIATFALSTGKSVLDDVSYRSPGTSPVTGLMNSDPWLARAMEQNFAVSRSKPLLRCENCEKSPDMIEGSPKFMMCSICKSKLDFVIHYCSQSCQKEDWRRHKKHCGKKKVSKDLRGTIHDPFWMEPHMPDFLRDLPRDADGEISIIDMGFMAPAASHPFTPALQRQVSLWTADKNIDYFIFDEADRPVCLVIPLKTDKLAFRKMRQAALSSVPSERVLGVKFIGDYLLKRTPYSPWLTRGHILNQLGWEYGENMKKVILEFEKVLETRRFPPGLPYLEWFNSHMAVMWPRFRE